MKHSTNYVFRGCLFLTAMALGVSVLADVSSDTSSTIQRDRALVQPYQRVNILGKRSKKTASHSAQGVTGASSQGYTASSVMLGTINLPGSSQNNTRLRNAMTSVRSKLTSMKTATSAKLYDQYQNAAFVGLDAAVGSYMDSRKAYAVPVTQTESDNDVFLQAMAALKIDVMRKSLSDVELDDMLNRLAAARGQLVDLSEALQ